MAVDPDIPFQKNPEALFPEAIEKSRPLVIKCKCFENINYFPDENGIM